MFSTFFSRASNYSAERHYKSLHGQEQPLQCHICSDVLKNQAVFNAHMKQKHSMNMSTVRSSVPRPSVKATRVPRKSAAAAANVKREPGSSSRRRGAAPVATAPRKRIKIERIKIERKDVKKEIVAVVKKEEAEDQKPVVVVKEEKKDDEGNVIILTQHN